MWKKPLEWCKLSRDFENRYLGKDLKNGIKFWKNVIEIQKNINMAAKDKCSCKTV